MNSLLNLRGLLRIVSSMAILTIEYPAIRSRKPQALLEIWHTLSQEERVEAFKHFL